MSNVGRQVRYYNCYEQNSVNFVSTVVLDLADGRVVVDYIIYTREGDEGLLILDLPTGFTLDPNDFEDEYMGAIRFVDGGPPA